MYAKEKSDPKFGISWFTFAAIDDAWYMCKNYDGNGRTVSYAQLTWAS